MHTLALLLTTCLLSSPGNRLVSREMGIAMDLPDHATILQRPGEVGESVFLIREGRTTPQWSVRIESLSNMPEDLKTCLADIITERAPDAQGPTLEPIQLDLEGQPALMQWLKRPMPQRGTVLMGLLVASRGHGHNLLVTAITVPDAGQNVLDALDRMFASARLLDREAAQTHLIHAMTRGEQLLRSLNDKDLKNLAGRREILRIYDPNAEGHGEIAYGTLEATIAPRNAIETHSRQATAVETPEGLLVTTHLRFVDDAEAGRYTDRLQQCWVSFDLLEEAWVDRSTVREGDLRHVSTEIGLREPPSTSLPKGQILVVRQEGASGIRDTNTLIPEGSWLPRALRWLIWDVAEAAPSDIAWQTWDDSTVIPRTTIRFDAWQNPRRCWSWSGLAGLPTALSFTPGGMWTRATLPNGTVIECTDEQTVTARWKAAGLSLR
ncbi:MAG: hypothetical protein MK100_02940 [Phycisphaerales bacterium]|nr:hypothetical protein [Phycisphaerales bacterium]